MSRPLLSTLFGAALVAVPLTLPAAESAPDAAKLEFFEKKIRPLLVDNCYNCHSADNKAAGGLRVDDRSGIFQGGGRGAGIVPGKPDESWLIKAVTRTDAKLKMPPDNPLSEEQIADLRKWIEEGAAWPALEIPADLTRPPADYDALRQNHWAWQPLKAAAVPAVQDPSWARDDIDRFLLSALEAKNLKPVADADKVTLLRRVTFDLTGLPPSPEEIAAFLADSSPEAFEQVVDRLLQSSAYGEHWGRHWLDVARYAESTGSARNLPYPQAWKYRDYVIDAFNKDKPFDQFVREQIAGDLLPHENDDQKKEHLVATGFLALGVKDVNQRFKVRFVMDNIDEQIDVVTRSVLGLTASCARCHDHKFDPIPTSDYYALAGIFQSTDLCAGLRNQMGGSGLAYYDTNLLLVLSENRKEIDPELAKKIEEAKKVAEEARLEFVKIRDSAESEKPGPDGRPQRVIARQKWNRLQAEVVALTDPAAVGEVALGARDSKTIADTEIRLRGEAEKLGPRVPRGFLSVLNLPNPPAITADRSGRLELADWLVRQDNPLAPRVAVNRVWHHLFGAGLVKTVDNFGVTGDAPSHPELLDHLALRFQRDGWSVKRLIRTLVLTRAYGLGSEATDDRLAADPANRLVWRHSPRRLTAEELRDAALTAAGRLDRARPSDSPSHKFRVIELPNNGPQAAGLDQYARGSVSRSVYLPLLRTLVPKSLEVFDFAEQGMVTGSRDVTTVATQALYLLNDQFIRRQSLAFAESLIAQPAADDNERIERAYLLALGRTPTSDERLRATEYLGEYTTLADKLLADSFARLASEANPTVPPPPPTPVQNPAKEDATAVDQNDLDPRALVTKEPPIEPRDARTAAWTSFVQALLGSGDFQYVQ